jgi:hypothetical protein
MRVIAAAVVVLVAAVPAWAQPGTPAQGKTTPAPPTAPPPNPLSLIPAFRCTFPSFAATEWHVGKPETEVGSESTFSFRVTNIDTRRNAARIVANRGSVDATAVLRDSGLTVIEQTGIGNFIVTTIFRAGGKDRVYIAVHSRHLGDMETVPSVSQHFGTCEPIEAEANPPAVR